MGLPRAWRELQVLPVHRLAAKGAVQRGGSQMGTMCPFQRLYRRRCPKILCGSACRKRPKAETAQEACFNRSFCAVFRHRLGPTARSIARLADAPPHKPSTRGHGFGAAGEISISNPLGLAVFNLVLCQGHPRISRFSRTPRIEHGCRTVRSDLSARRTTLQATSPGPCHLSGDPLQCIQGRNTPPATSPGRYMHIYFLTSNAYSSRAEERLVLFGTSRQLGVPPVVSTNNVGEAAIAQIIDREDVCGHKEQTASLSPGSKPERHASAAICGPAVETVDRRATNREHVCQMARK
ncbi:hypothetical protein JB92DRAFT_2827477 [Gautieria morchelliformis]|nr:hypothetical protein JB92DRAFT_2827477 [Gautieria morchelliformis]